jgi:rare lipoprotein A (peptidoglycan hydrolase)
MRIVARVCFFIVLGITILSASMLNVEQKPRKVMGEDACSGLGALYEEQYTFSHTVREGESLHRILKLYKGKNIWIRLDQVLSWNTISHPNSISPGKVLQLAVLRWSAQCGEASWYGKRFHGKKTASGEIFRMNDPRMVAHKDYPIGMPVEIINLENGQRLRAIVRDRGPYIEKRVVDVSRAGAEKLGFRVDGTANVKIIPLG